MANSSDGRACNIKDISVSLLNQCPSAAENRVLQRGIIASSPCLSVSMSSSFNLSSVLLQINLTWVINISGSCAPSHTSPM